MYGCNMSDNKVEIGAAATENFLKERLFPWLMSQKVSCALVVIDIFSGRQGEITMYKTVMML